MLRVSVVFSVAQNAFQGMGLSAYVTFFVAAASLCSQAAKEKRTSWRHLKHCEIPSRCNPTCITTDAWS